MQAQGVLTQRGLDPPGFLRPNYKETDLEDKAVRMNGWGNLHKDMEAVLCKRGVCRHRLSERELSDGCCRGVQMAFKLRDIKGHIGDVRTILLWYECSLPPKGSCVSGLLSTWRCREGRAFTS